MQKFFAVVGEYRVLCVGAGVAGCDFLRHDFRTAPLGETGDVVVFRKKFVVPAGVFTAHLQFVVQMVELHAEDGGLNGVESAVHAADFVDVPFAATVVRDQANLLGEAVVLRKECAAVAVAAERFCRVKARGRNIAERAGLFSVLRGSESLSRVFDKPKSVFFCDFLDFLVIRALAEQVDGDDSARLFANQFFDAFGADLERFGIDVREFRDAAEPHDAFGGGDKRKVGDDDFVARFKPEGEERNRDGVCAASAGDRVLCAGVLTEFRFESLDDWPADVATAVQDVLFCL